MAIELNKFQKDFIKTNLKLYLEKDDFESVVEQIIWYSDEDTGVDDLPSILKIGDFLEALGLPMRDATRSYFSKHKVTFDELPIWNFIPCHFYTENDIMLGSFEYDDKDRPVYNGNLGVIEQFENEGVGIDDRILWLRADDFLYGAGAMPKIDGVTAELAFGYGLFDEILYGNQGENLIFIDIEWYF